MSKARSRLWAAGRLAGQALQLDVDQGGNVATVMGFTLIPVVRAMGAGFELANWYRQKHSMQNAAARRRLPRSSMAVPVMTLKPRL